MVMRRAPCQFVVGIEAGKSHKIVVGGIAIEQRADARLLVFGMLKVRVADDNQSFLAIGDVEEAVKEVHRKHLLLFVLGELMAKRIDAERGGRGNGHRVFRRDIEALTERRYGSRDGALREIFVVEIGDVVDAESVLAHRGVEIFAAALDVENFRARVHHVAGGVAVALFEFAAAGDEFVVVIGPRELLQVAAVNRGRLIVLGDSDGFVAFVAGGDVDVARP